MSSVRDIAQRAGVSIATVSRALNNDSSVNVQTRERVLNVANRLGYVASMGRRSTTTLAFTYTGTQTLSHPFDAAVLEGVVHGGDEGRFNIVILSLQRDKQANETYTQFFMRHGVRGVILRTMRETRDICIDIANEGFPHVVLSERFDEDNVDYIDGDSRESSFQAVEYLLRLGHRRIAFGVHNEVDLDHTDRLTGYRQALEGAGITYDESLVFKQRYTLSGGATIMRMIMSMKDRPTAAYFADPLLGVGAMKTAHELGIRVPQDISIVCFDDTDMRFVTSPSMSAVCQDAQALGYEASLWLSRRLMSKGPEQLRKTIPTFFEVNGSTDHPPEGAGNGAIELDAQ